MDSGRANATRVEPAEDSIEYRLFLLSNDSSYTHFETIRRNVLADALLLSRNYIWHVDPINFTIDADQSCLRGTSLYAENSEDEWFIIWIMIQLSKKYPDAIITVADHDGDPLLIEAAEYLPDWLLPENSLNRVFIKLGRVHIIPIDRFPNGIQSALIGAKLLSESSENYYNEKVTGAILSRVEKYFMPGEAIALHRCNIRVCSNLALIIRDNPQLVSAAVHAFHRRDRSEMKFCRELKHFGANYDGDDLCTTSVVFTRCQYAMLATQRYAPDRRQKWPIVNDGDAMFNATDIGLKLTCGFEILICNYELTADDSKTTSSPIIDRNEDVEAFIQQLLKIGYFADYSPGSMEYEANLHKARDFYRYSSNPPELFRNLAGYQLKSAFASKLSPNIARMLLKSDNPLPEDDASWLTDAMRSCPSAAANGDMGLPDSDRLRVKTLIDSVKDFLYNCSGPAADGAEFRSTSSESNRLNLPSVNRDIGSSFERLLDLEEHSKRPACDERSVSSDSDDSYGDESLTVDLSEAQSYATKMKEYLKVMDKELAPTTMGESFVKKRSTERTMQPSDGDSIDLADDDFDAVDVDKNLADNWLQSYLTEKATSAGRGPTSTIMSSANFNPLPFAGESHTAAASSLPNAQNVDSLLSGRHLDVGLSSFNDIKFAEEDI